MKRAIEKAKILVTNYNNLKSDKKNDVHFLHIGKCAGSQIKFIANMVKKESSLNIIKHEHFIKIDDIPIKSKYFFAIRKPDARFVSAFYSRKRKGAPKNYNEWSINESKAFSKFEHANELAEALYEKGGNGQEALHAMLSIRHVNTYQVDWIKSLNKDIFEDENLIGIIRQENFNNDVIQILKKLNIKNPREKISNNEIDAHKNDYTNIPNLTEKAKKNLSIWYSQDWLFYEKCVGYIRK